MITVLHVDGDPKFTEITAEYLIQDGPFDITASHDPSEALDSFEDESPDCVVSEYNLPGMTGIEFLKQIRERDATIPFILFTGRGSETVASEAITAGATDYLKKGRGTDRYQVLANRISNAVERTQAVRQAELSHRAMETATEGISFVEPDGTFSYVNPAFAELFGYEPAELVEQDWTILYHDEEAMLY